MITGLCAPDGVLRWAQANQVSRIRNVPTDVPFHKLMNMLVCIILNDDGVMRHTDFDLNLLTVLNVLFEERSVTRTGQRLGRTQSAISNSLRKLRDTLGDPLLVRGAEGMVLTPKATALQVQVRELADMAEACLAGDGPFDPALADGDFRIGAPDRLSLPVMLPLLQTLRHRAPGVDIDLITTDRDQALALLDDDQIHLAVGWFERAPERFAAELMFEERLTVLCRQDHPILSVDNVDLETVLSFEHLVVSSSGDRKAGFDDLLARRGKRRDVAVSVSNFSVVTDLLNGDDLIGIFTRRVADVLAQRFGLATLDTPSEIPALDHYMVWHNRFDTDRRHEWLRARVTEACAG